jgi:hypothetical protein
LRNLGAEVATMTQAQFASLVQAEAAAAAGLIRTANIRID